LFAPPNDILTPASVESKPISKYGSAPLLLDPPYVGPAIVLLQADAKLMQEHLVDACTQRYVGRPINQKAHHLAAGQLRELVYQATNTPILWTIQPLTGKLI